MLTLYKDVIQAPCQSRGHANKCVIFTASTASYLFISCPGENTTKNLALELLVLKDLVCNRFSL